MNIRPFKIAITTIANHAFRSHTDINNASYGFYSVNLDPAQILEQFAKPHAVLAHEIGHILGVEYGLPKHTAFIENMKNFPVGIEEATLAREREAWDLAEAVFDVQRLRTSALMSYERKVSLEDLFAKLEAFKRGPVKTTD